MKGSSSRCPTPTNALLRIWVDERATILVNGHKTKSQRLAGVNRGSRMISLTGLVPGDIQEAVVEATLVSYGTPLRLTERLPVQAGESFEVRFTQSEFNAARPVRVTSDLLVLYDFKRTNNAKNMVLDVSQQGSPLDLLINKPGNVSWINDGLKIEISTLIQSGQTADKIRTAVENTNEISVEAWVTPSQSKTQWQA